MLHDPLTDRPALRIGLPVVIAIAAADQVVKQIVLALVFGLPFRGAPLTAPAQPVIGVLDLVTVWNRGVSFGMFGAVPPVALTALTLALACGLTLWLWRVRDRVQATALALTIGGAVGNLIDRIRFGAVFDFLDVHLSGWHWPAFNLADSAITLGVMVLLWRSARGGEARGDAQGHDASATACSKKSRNTTIRRE